MVEVHIDGSKAAFTVQGWHKLWALRSQLEIPLEHIKDVHTDASPKMGWFQGLKVLGTDLPRVFRAGTFYQDGGWVFWDVLHAEKVIVVELHDERFQKLVIEVADPTAEVQKLKQALASGRA